MHIEEVKKKLVEQRIDLRKTFHVKKIGIFGSFVQNKQTRRSDVDILVEFEKGHKDFFNYMRLKYHLETSLGRQVDLVIKEAVKPRLKDRIFNEVVYV
jgi:predicted nucleotidyltransferase